MFEFLVFCEFGCPKAPFWESFCLLFGSLGPLESESEKVCLDCTGVCGLHIQPSGKMTFPIIFGVFFKSALREASETRFFGFRAILGSLGMTIWLQKGIKK